MRLKILTLLLVLAVTLWGCAGDPPPDPTQVSAPERESPFEAENPISSAEESAPEAESKEAPVEEAASEAIEEAGETETNDTGEQPTTEVAADVIDVGASGEAGNYQFSVTIRSPDTGCEQYADWWEVLDENGNLLYRRILTHSHASEQPFTRSGGPVAIEADQVVIVRAHMVRAGAQSHGYGGIAFKGTVENGFSKAILESGFAIDLEAVEPLPTGCAF
jgi:hypothetical protein